MINNFFLNYDADTDALYISNARHPEGEEYTVLDLAKNMIAGFSGSCPLKACEILLDEEIIILFKKDGDKGRMTEEVLARIKAAVCKTE